MFDKIKEIEKKKDHFVLLLVASAKDYKKETIDLLHYFVDEGNSQCIYITANEAYSILAEDLKAENVRTDQIFFIDMVTKYVGTPKEEAPNCIFIDSPQDLTDMAIVMQQAADHFKGKCPLIILDSISTLLIYNDIKVISKFSHFFTEKIKLWKAKGVVFSVQKETDEKLMELLTQFCDERVDL